MNTPSMTPQLPTKRWVKSQLRSGAGTFQRIRVDFVTAYWVKSFAVDKQDRPGELGIGIVIQPRQGVSSLQFSEAYHSRFTSEQTKPRWQEAQVDFQFFYPNDPQLKSYEKVELVD